MIQAVRVERLRAEKTARAIHDIHAFLERRPPGFGFASFADPREPPSDIRASRSARRASRPDANGASSIAHWFQPMGASGVRHGQTGQVHNSMFNFGKNNKLDFVFSGSELLKES